MARLEEDEFTLAKRIFTNIDAITDPMKRIQAFETGIDLLGKYVLENQPLEEETEGEIKELRSACLKKTFGFPHRGSRWVHQTLDGTCPDSSWQNETRTQCCHSGIFSEYRRAPPAA